MHDRARHARQIVGRVHELRRDLEARRRWLLPLRSHARAAHGCDELEKHLTQQP
jgi:5-formyltetrahydrofolate cyclo-ligase